MRNKSKRNLITDMHIFYLLFYSLIIMIVQSGSLFLFTEIMETDLNRKALTTANEMQQILAEPLYNIDEIQAVRIGEAVLGSGRISGIELFSAAGGHLLSKYADSNSGYLTKIQRDIVYQDIFLGKMTLYFSSDELRSTQKYMLGISSLIIIVVIVFNILVTRFFLVRMARKPFACVINGIKAITEGDYDVIVSQTPYNDVNIFIDSINTMAKKIRINNSELVSEKERISVTLRSIGDGVITTDTNGIVNIINKAGENITGWKTEEAEGKHINDILGLIDFETREKIAIPVDPNNETDVSLPVFDRTVLYKSRNSTTHMLSVTASRIIINDRNSGTVIVFKDITRDYQITEQLRQSQKMDAIGQLAGGIAHDFNNMLSAILGAAELTRLEDLKNDNVSKYLGTIENAARRSASLISKLLDFARSGAGSKIPVDIRKIINDSVAILENTIDKSIKIETSFKTCKTMVTADSSQIQNTLINMGINASHAMPHGGTLSFTADTRYLDSSYCELSIFDIEEGNYLDIEVRDTGTGIPYDLQGKIFEPFFTTKEPGKGTGLGLSSAYGTIKDHNGAIDLYSEPGTGTKFHIYLPLRGEGLTETTDIYEIVPGTGLILLADDEKPIRETSKAVLEKLGYSVILAENGLNAVELYRENSEKIDLVILDMIMPVMNGAEAFNQIKKINSRCRVLVASGFSRKDDIEKMKQDGIAGFIQKPFSVHELSGIISSALGK